MEAYVQARIGGNQPAVNTGKWAVATFEHDSSRPVDGYAAPNLHTHCLIFNISTTEEGAHAIQPHELFRTQRFGTAIYRAELAMRLRELGYEIERGEHCSPEIKGYSKDFVEASSPRRAQIKRYEAEHNVFGAEAREIAAHSTREKKQQLSRDEVLAQHQTMAVKYGNQPLQVIAQANQHGHASQLATTDAEAVAKSVRSAIDRNMERDAVVDERAILADALRHGMGSVRTSEVEAAFSTAVQRGSLIEVSMRNASAAHSYTTPEMKGLEADVLHRWNENRNKYEATAPQEVQIAVIQAHSRLNESQQNAVRQILNNRDPVVGLEGPAGTGKTTALRAICDAAKEAGYQVEGLAPTSRAALNLRDAGIETKTIARHLTERRSPESSPQRIYIVDEASMISTRQMGDFLTSIREVDRVLLVGDCRQHESVDAGRIFAQLKEAGMQTAQLTEIIRQQDASLKAAVQQLYAGDVPGAIRNLAAQKRVHEYRSPAEGIRDIARAYIEKTGSTLIVCPDNASRLEIAKSIHTQMQELGMVNREEQAITVLVPRQDLTSEDRRWAQNFEPGDVLRYTRGNKTIDVAARELVHVQAVNEKENLITVQRQNGELVTYDPRSIYGVTAFREAERTFAEGDRVQFTSLYHAQKVANRELGTIAALDESGNLQLQMDSGRTIEFNVRQHPSLDYGYAVTSYSSQGETTDNVLIYLDSEHAHKGLINSRMAYVSVSRARFDAQIFTNDAESLGRELGKDVSHSSALQAEEMNQLTESFNQVANEHSGATGMELDGASISHDLEM
jgi:ATP-dependent exoDNAse (exonuclease V) alpha subunit